MLKFGMNSYINIFFSDFLFWWFVSFFYFINFLGEYFYLMNFFSFNLISRHTFIEELFWRFYFYINNFFLKKNIAKKISNFIHLFFVEKFFKNIFSEFWPIKFSYIIFHLFIPYFFCCKTHVSFHYFFQ